MAEKINITDKFSCFNETWQPKVIASLNGQEVKLVKAAKAKFPWHTHENEDEMFIVWQGRFRVDFRDHSIELGPGEAIVVPHGTEHRTAADEEAQVLLFEPAATRNTGNVVDEHFTAPDGVRI